MGLLLHLGGEAVQVVWGGFGDLAESLGSPGCKISTQEPWGRELAKGSARGSVMPCLTALLTLQSLQL